MISSYLKCVQLQFQNRWKETGQGVGEQKKFFAEIMAEISEGKKNHHLRQIEHRDQDGRFKSNDDNNRYNR